MTQTQTGLQAPEIFHLTDEQWALVEPLLAAGSPADPAGTPADTAGPLADRARRPARPPSASPPSGRPRLDDRLVLEAVLWKNNHLIAWYDLPAAYPSWQTCYRRYHRWQRQGLLTEIIRLLYLDLRHRGGLDLFSALRQGAIHLELTPAGWLLTNPAGWSQPWHRHTARFFAALILTRIKTPSRRLPLLPSE